MEEPWTSRSASSTSAGRSWWTAAESAKDVEKAFAAALSDDAVLRLTDAHGRQVLIPANKIAYIDLGEENARRVGFGTL